MARPAPEPPGKCTVVVIAALQSFASPLLSSIALLAVTANIFRHTSSILLRRSLSLACSPAVLSTPRPRAKPAVWSSQVRKVASWGRRARAEAQTGGHDEERSRYLPSKMKIACLQFSPQVGDVDHNMTRADMVLAKAGEVEKMGLDLLVLPEMAFTGKCFAS